MKRKLEYTDMKIGALLEGKPKSTSPTYLPGKLFKVHASVRQHCGVGYATHYTLEDVATGRVFSGRLPLSSLRQYLHKPKS